MRLDWSVGRPRRWPQPTNVEYTVTVNSTVTIASFTFGDGKTIVLGPSGVLIISSNTSGSAACVQNEAQVLASSASAAAATAQPTTTTVPGTSTATVATQSVVLTATVRTTASATPATTTAKGVGPIVPTPASPTATVASATTLVPSPTRTTEPLSSSAAAATGQPSLVEASSTSLGVIIGASVGGAAVILLLLLVIILVAATRKRRRLARQRSETQRSLGASLRMSSTAPVVNEFEMYPNAMFANDATNGEMRSDAMTYPDIRPEGTVGSDFAFQPYDPAYYFTRSEIGATDQEIYDRIGRGTFISEFPEFAGDDAVTDDEAGYSTLQHEAGDDYAAYERDVIQSSRKGVYDVVRRERQALARTMTDVRPAPAPDSAVLATLGQQRIVEQSFRAIYETGRDVLRKKQYLRQWLTFREVIGQGDFGVVALATTTDGGIREPDQVVVKALREDASEQDTRDFLGEAKMMTKFDHANVLRLVGVCMPEQPWLMLLEHCAYGDLRGFLRTCVRTTMLKVTLAEQCHLGAQVAAGMEYLESLFFVHRDLCARNGLVGAGTIVKIAGFGPRRERNEPVRWMAIESIERRVFTSRSDVWSMGVLLWEIATFGTLQPYRGVRPSRILPLLRAGKRLYQPRGCSPELYDVMHRCWYEDEEHRPTFADIKTTLQHMCDGQPIRDLGRALDELTSTAT